MALSGDESNSNKGNKKQYHRHSAEQIQKLESFYRECPHPDKNEREQLSRELGLDQKQIKFWFQNKRTQKKVQGERADNNALRSENEKIHYENLAMQEALQNIICPSCNSLGTSEEERQRNLQRLKLENFRLKEEHEKAINFFTNYVGTPLMSNMSGFEPTFANVSRSELPQRNEVGIENPYDISRNPESIASRNVADKSAIFETAVDAMTEIIELLRIEEPLWINSSKTDHGRFHLHRESYNALFPKPNRHKSTPSARFESSKDSCEVALPAVHLVEMLLDSNKRKDMFVNIVTEAKTIQVLNAGDILGGSLQLIYEKTHILSPLVAAREFFLIRYCRQLDTSTWAMVDASYDLARDAQQDSGPVRAWKLPSGCMISDTANGKSKITWIEHVQVDDKASTHRLYRDLLCNAQPYGARLWTATLKRMCERFALSMGLVIPPRTDREGVIESLEGRRNLMSLSHRIVSNFCEGLCMSDYLDFSNLSEMTNNGVRVSLRKCSEPDQGFVISATTSIRFPLSFEDLFAFLRDENRRAEWDALLSSGYPVTVMAQISTGADPGNCISIIQPFAPQENNMLMVQETSIDSCGARMIYAPIDLPSILAVINGQDSTRIPIISSGYVVSSDGCLRTANNGASSSSNANTGSLLTIAFQILVGRTALTRQLSMESVANVHSLISKTVQKITAALDCSD